MTLPQTMTEIIITEPGGPEVLEARESPLPQPGSGELLIRVATAGVNRPDLLQRAGLYPMPPGVNPTPGLEVAGEVVAVGADVTDFAVGNRVCGLTEGGGYAEYCLLRSGQTLPWPSTASAEQAAAIPETFFTVWANLFMTGRATAGETVLIHGGASGIGTTALMLARAFGIQALATAGSDEKCALIRELGATAIHYRREDFLEAALQHSGGRGVDVILDIVGGPYFSNNLKALSRDGRLVIIGFMAGAVAERVDLRNLMLKRVTVTGSTLRARSAAEKAAIADGLREQVWPLLEKGECLPIIHARFPLREAAAAHRLMASGEHAGKIVLTVD